MILFFWHFLLFPIRYVVILLLIIFYEKEKPQKSKSKEDPLQNPLPYTMDLRTGKHNTSTAWGDAGLSRTGAVDAGGGPFFELRSRPSSPYHPATHLRLNSHPIAGA